jgi:hypothetical protein
MLPTYFSSLEPCGGWHESTVSPSLTRTPWNIRPLCALVRVYYQTRKGSNPTARKKRHPNQTQAGCLLRRGATRQEIRHGARVATFFNLALPRARVVAFVSASQVTPAQLEANFHAALV